uniref:Uncharacterized protein n=1 Tax=Rhizophora mucronata TaxID=61149 RepID=A0A2P2MEA9_RHIMU
MHSHNFYVLPISKCRRNLTTNSTTVKSNHL